MVPYKRNNNFSTHPTNNNISPFHKFNTRTPTQCDACKQWGHSVGTCIMTAKVQHIMDFISKHPPVAKRIATTWAKQNSRQQRSGAARMLMGGNEYNIDDTLCCDEIVDFSFDTNLDDLDF